MREYTEIERIIATGNFIRGVIVGLTIAIVVAIVTSGVLLS